MKIILKNPIVVDATDSPIGRIASFAAKQSLHGKEIAIVNCNDAVISGRKALTLEDYRQMRTKGKGSNTKGPHFPKNPERIVKRTIRGMLSYKQDRGDSAFRRIICYNKVPSEYENSKKISLQKEFKVKTLKLKELSKLI